jgi:hypothetical protein
MRKLLGTVVLMGMLGMPGVVDAQTVIGAAAAYHDDFEAIGIGGYASIPMPQIHENIAINPSLIYYFPDDPFKAFEINGDVVYRFPVSADSPVIPFAMAGLNIWRTSVDGIDNSGSTDVGINLGGGIVFPLESVRPAVGAKFEIQDVTSFVIFGGIGFPVGN